MTYTVYPRSARLGISAAGALFATIGSLSQTHPQMKFIVGFAIIYGALAFRRELKLCADAQRFTWVKGMFPWVTRRSGSLSELRYVLIDVVVHKGECEDGHTYWTSVCGNLGDQDLFTVHYSPNFKKSERVTLELAELIRVPVVETPALQQHRPAIGSAVYDHRLTGWEA